MIFKQFDTTDIVAGRTQPVSTGMWSDGEIAWSAFFTSSAQTKASSSNYEPLNGLYYTNVYDANPDVTASADIYFSLAYGHVDGIGSSTFDTSSQGSLLYPTKAIYNQYRNLLLTPGDQLFTFVSSSAGGQVYIDSKEIYVVSFRNTKFKDRLDPGQFEITLSTPTGSIRLIDDSPSNTNTGVQSGGKRYNLVRGSVLGGATIVGEYTGIGTVYPDLGIVVLNPKMLTKYIGILNGHSFHLTAGDPAKGEEVINVVPTTGWNGQYERLPELLFESISAGAVVNPMQARVTEYVPARHFFVRVKNQEYNYSNNPTFVINSTETTGSQDIGKLRFADFYTDPKVYITTVGLYNESNDLVAVAKLSQPLLKDFTNECLIKIKIDI
jgi:hypothetical protein